MDQNVFLLGDKELMGIDVEVGDDQTPLALGVERPSRPFNSERQIRVCY